MYDAGWGRAEIAVEPRGHAMFGYGMWHHRARGRQTALYARAVCLGDGARRLIVCCADLGSISYVVRSGVCAALRERLGEAFDEAALVLTCTHTHSGPGGCSHEALYNVVTPGFVTPHWRAVVAAITEAITAAWRSAAPTELRLYEAPFAADVPVAWNRSLRAYNRNPDVVARGESERHLALDRSMPVLGLLRDGTVQALLSLFGVHATCIGNTRDHYDGDNKGYAAAHAEQALPYGLPAQSPAHTAYPHKQPTYRILNYRNGDLHYALGRARLFSHEIRVTVNKVQTAIDDPGRLLITALQSRGAVQDLYEFSFEGGIPADVAAILQIGFDPGDGRFRGQIFRSVFEFDELWEQQPW